MEQLPLGVRLRPASTMAGFRVGANGSLAAAIEARATTAALSPLLLWSAAGQGRTHLLQAACALAGEAGRRAGYLPLGEPWLDPAMLAGLESLDLVCLDDVGTVLGRDPWERGLFGLYNDLQERGGNLVLSAGTAPAGLTVRLPDLASRLAACVVFQLRGLDEAEQGVALQERARSLGVELPDETLQYLQRRLPRDLATLCTALDRLDAASLSHQRRLTVPFVRSVLELAGD
jgi:DnaA family protein